MKAANLLRSQSSEHKQPSEHEQSNIPNIGHTLLSSITMAHTSNKPTPSTSDPYPKGDTQPARPPFRNTFVAHPTSYITVPPPPQKRHRPRNKTLRREPKREKKSNLPPRDANQACRNRTPDAGRDNNDCHPSPKATAHAARRRRTPTHGA